jgi:hypothetical protein
MFKRYMSLLQIRLEEVPPTQFEENFVLSIIQLIKDQETLVITFPSLSSGIQTSTIAHHKDYPSCCPLGSSIVKSGTNQSTIDKKELNYAPSSQYPSAYCEDIVCTSLAGSSY